jgi:hypothetical protein
MNIAGKTTGTDAISQMITRVVDRFDTDKDGKLSADEFGKFLGGLLQNGNLGAAATPDPSKATGQYRMMLAGFDHNKLDNPSMQGAGTIKYQAARIFQNYAPMPESLPAVIADLKAQGVNATQIGIDKIDFNDGYGPIDVIQGAYPGGGVAWQWLPQSLMS